MFTSYVNFNLLVGKHLTRKYRTLAKHRDAVHPWSSVLEQPVPVDGHGFIDQVIVNAHLDLNSGNKVFCYHLLTFVK